MLFESTFGNAVAYLINFLIFIVVNLIILLSSYKLLVHFFFVRRVGERLLKLVILMLAQIVLVHTCLAFTKTLTFLHLIAGFCAILISTYLFISDKRRPIDALPVHQELALYLKSIWSLITSQRLTMLISAGVFGYFVALLITALEHPVYVTDTLFYHFPIPVAIAQSHSLFDYPQWMSYDQFYYNINANYLILWSLIPFNGDFIARLFEVPFPFFIMLGVYVLLRRLNLRRNNAFLLSLFAISAPWTLRRSIHVTGVDGVFTFLIIAVVLSIYIYTKKPSLSNVAFLTITAGLFVGTKLLALSYMMGVVVALVYFYGSQTIFDNKHQRIGALSFGKIGMHLLILLGGMFVLGGTIFLRNFVEYGSPIFPMAVPFMPETGGAYHPVSMNIPAFYYRFKMFAGMGELFQSSYLIVGFSMLFAFIALWLRSWQSESKTAFTALCLCILFMWIGFAIYPFWTQHLRYYIGIVFASLAVQVAFLPFESKRFGALLHWVSAGIVSLALFFSVITSALNGTINPIHLIIASVLTALLLMYLNAKLSLAQLFDRLGRNRKAAVMATSTVTVVLAVLSLILYLDYPRVWNNNMTVNNQSVFSWLNKFTSDHGKNILVLNYEEPNMYLYGVNLQNRVVLAPRYAVGERTEARFLQFLENQHIDLIYYKAMEVNTRRDIKNIADRYCENRDLTPGRKYYPLPFSWVQQNVNLFKELTRDNDTYIFEYLPDNLQAYLLELSEKNEE